MKSEGRNQHNDISDTSTSYPPQSMRGDHTLLSHDLYTSSTIFKYSTSPWEAAYLFLLLITSSQPLYRWPWNSVNMFALQSEPGGITCDLTEDIQEDSRVSPELNPSIHNTVLARPTRHQNLCNQFSLAGEMTDDCRVGRVGTVTLLRP